MKKFAERVANGRTFAILEGVTTYLTMDGTSCRSAMAFSKGGR